MAIVPAPDVLISVLLNKMPVSELRSVLVRPELAKDAAREMFPPRALIIAALPLKSPMEIP